MKNRTMHVLGWFALLAALGFVGNEDYKEEVRQAEMYCAAVHDKVHPDYKGVYVKECDNGLLRQ